MTSPLADSPCLLLAIKLTRAVLEVLEHAAGIPDPPGVPLEVLADDDPRQLVTLAQMSGLVRRSKRTLKHYTAQLPLPFVEGGGGHPAFWRWSEVRPVLEKLFHIPLPERFPDVYRIR